MKEARGCRWRAVLMTVVLAIAFVGCGIAGSDSENDFGDVDRLRPNAMKGIGLASYASCMDLETEVEEIFIQEMESIIDRMKTYCVYRNGDGTADSGDAADGGEENSSSTTDTQDPTYTGTNLQVAGVDEADLIKTDGKYSFSVVKDQVHINHIWPLDDFGLISSIDPRGKPTGLYLYNDRLVVISYENPCDEYCTWSEWKKMIITTWIEVFDVTNPAQPLPLSASSYKGYVIDSRRIGSKLHLSVSGKIVRPELDFEIDRNLYPTCSKNGDAKPSAALLARVNELKKKNIETIKGLTLDDFFLAPEMKDEESCRSVLRSHASFGSWIYTLYTDDLDDQNDHVQRTSLLGQSGTIYASEDNLFIAGQKRSFWEIFFSPDSYEEATIIHRFSLRSGAPRYLSSVSVDGTILGGGYSSSNGYYSNGQFAMDEHNGYFRIATTDFGIGEEDAVSEGMITVFDLSSSVMTRVGEVRGLGQGESIYAVRFVGERGYVVTYEWIDPLYVVDLSDPANPRVAGELKVPGFSTYLHPLDESRIIGLGYNTDETNGWTGIDGLKLSLFDVSDASNPIEVGHRIIGSGGTYSSAAWQHHAFTLDRERGILSLPLKTWKKSEYGFYNGASEAGIVLLDVDDEGKFETIEEITFDDSNKGSWCNSTYVLRSIIIGDGENEGVVTLTTDGVHLNLIDDDMSEIGIVD